MGSLLFGHAPLALAIPLWIAIAVLFGVLWVAIGRQADREHAHRDQRDREQAERAAFADDLDNLADRLDHLTGRVERIEHDLYADLEVTEQWPNSAPDQ